MKRLQVMFLLVLSLTALTSFQDQGTLTGKWTLICFTDFSGDTKDCRPSDYSPRQLTFSFVDDGHQGNLRGLTTVNKVFGDYEVDKNRIQVDSFGGTKIAEHGWGSDFWNTIRNSSSFYFRQDTLVIRYDSDTKGMIFLPAE